MIFISHSADDQPAAQLVTDFLQASIQIPDEAVTSTSGRDPQPGSGNAELRQLKSELNRSSLIVAIITPESIRTDWVLFELGAAWALGKRLYLVFTPGVDFRDLPEPLNDYPYISVESADAHIRMMDTVRDIATYLGVPEKRGGHIFPLLERTIRALGGEATGHTKRAAETPDSRMDDVPASDPFAAECDDEYCNIIYTADNATRSEQIAIRVLWDDLFKTLAPLLREPQDDAFIKKIVLGVCREHDSHFGRNLDCRLLVNPMMNPLSYARIIKRLASSNYIATTRGPSSAFRTKSENTFWRLTPEGEEQLRRIMNRRKPFQKWDQTNNLR